MSALHDCLQRQSAVLREFARALDEEANAMAEGRFRQLPPLLARKQALGRQLADLDCERERLQRETGFDPAGPPRPGQQDLHAAWQGLCESARGARDHNHRNGVMVHTLLDFTRQAMAVLQGDSRPLYGQDGRHPGGNGAGKPLAQG